MRKNLLVPLAVSLLFLGNAYGQEKAEAQLPTHAGSARGDTGPRGDPRLCADLPGQTSATHRFRYVGETIEIPLRGDSVPASLADCEPVALGLHWANGRNNGSVFNVTFLDGNNRPIYTRQISGFLSGVLEIPLSTFDAQPVYGASLTMFSVPTTVTIQAVPIFAAPVSLSYNVTRVARKTGAGGRSRRQEEDGRAGSPAGQPGGGARTENEIVSIHNAVRLIGASRLPVVQIELKTSRPFPVRDVPLQLQIGKRVFIDELSGDHTGRKLTLSLTPEMFAELKDGDEIVAFFGKRDGESDQERQEQEAGAGGRSRGQDVWSFGKLIKSRKQ